MNHLTLEDIKIGMDIYIAHPFYGIDHIVVLGMPYVNSSTNSLFVEARIIYETWELTDSKSLDDAGITDFYNSRRSFRTLKEAEEYVNVSKTDADIIEKHIKHSILCDEWLDYLELDY